MGGRVGRPLLTPPSEETAERLRQRAEGLARSQLEAHEEFALQEEARYELHHLKAQAVSTLQNAMQNTGVCPKCRCPGIVVDKTAVTAALGVLDRSGLPPAKNVNVTDLKNLSPNEGELTKRAVMALVELEAVQIGAVVGALIRERPDARQFVEQAMASIAVEGMKRIDS